MQELAKLSQSVADEQGWMTFYGHVVDENNMPISQALVHVGYLHFDALRPQDWFTGYKKTEMKTDNSGNFVVSRIRGLSLDISVEKEGYYSSARSRKSINYSGASGGQSSQSDPSYPVVFELHRKGNAVPLVTWSDSVLVPESGASVDLVTGRTNSTTPDLKFQMWADPENKDKDFRYDWGFRLEVLNGGLIKTNGEFAFIAPESGYQGVDEGNYSKDMGTNWREQVEKSFFVQLRNGQFYGQLIVQMHPSSRYCQVSSRINPSGSRNLEPDPQFLFRDLKSYEAFVAKATGATK